MRANKNVPTRQLCFHCQLDALGAVFYPELAVDNSGVALTVLSPTPSLRPISALYRLQAAA